MRNVEGARQTAVKDALAKAQKIENPAQRLDVLVALLPRIPRQNRGQVCQVAIKAAKEMIVLYISRLSQALLELRDVPRKEQSQFISFIRGFETGNTERNNLKALGPYLSSEERQEVLNEVREATAGLSGVSKRLTSVAFLYEENAAEIPFPSLQDALATIAGEIQSEIQRMEEVLNGAEDFS